MSSLVVTKPDSGKPKPGFMPFNCFLTKTNLDCFALLAQ